MDSALLQQIQKGKGLKHVQTVDKTVVHGAGVVKDGSAPAASAPKPPTRPSAGHHDDDDDGASARPGAGGAPQLAGIFAGVGMPKLKVRLASLWIAQPSPVRPVLTPL